MSNLLVAITCPTHVSYEELHLKKPSAELGVQNSPTVKNSSALPFQVESSNPLFGCSELDLQSLSMIPCSIGWTIPKRGRWEESPSQQASISCQHSSSNTGRRSGRTPGKWRGTWLPSVHLKSEWSFAWCSLLCCRLKWPKWTVWGLMLLIKAYISAVLLRHLWENCWNHSGDHARFQRIANTCSFTRASPLRLFGSKINTLPYLKTSPPTPPAHNGAFGSKFNMRTSSECSLLTKYKTHSSELIFFTWEGERLYAQELRSQSSKAFWYHDAAWRIKLPQNIVLL